MPAQIVLVEDEQNIRDTVSYALRQEGHQVTAYADGEEAWKALERRLPDLLILDILLPRLDGLELCRRVRARSESLPLMFLTSRDEEFDRVLGLELGADDYLCKPFSVRELCARVKVLLRRGVRRESEERLRVGPLELDGPRHTARWKDQAVRLTVTEFRMLQCLARQPGVVQHPRAAPGRGLSPRPVHVRPHRGHAHQAPAPQARSRPTRPSPASKPSTGWATATPPKAEPRPRAARRRAPRRPPFFSRIAVRLLAFNLLLVFLPVAGFLYLDTYERQLLRSLEHALAQQARVLAASLSGRGPLAPAAAEAPLRALQGRHEARFRIVDPEGRLLADSSRLGTSEPAAPFRSRARDRRAIVPRHPVPRRREPPPVPPGLLPHPPGPPPVRPAGAALRVRRVLLRRWHAPRRGAARGAGRRLRRGHAHLRRRPALRHPVQRGARAGPRAGRRRGAGFPIHLPHPARPVRAAPAGLRDLPGLRRRRPWP